MSRAFGVLVLLLVLSPAAHADPQREKYDMGVIALRNKDCQAAAEAFNSVEGPLCDDPSFVNYAAQANECAGNLPKALEYYRKKEAFDPDKLKAREKIGEILYRMNKDSHAAAVLHAPTPLPTSTPPPSRQEEPAPVWMEVRLGYHFYEGDGWSTLGHASSFSTEVFEISGRLPLVHDNGFQFEAVPEFGYYGGSDSCIPDGQGNCIAISLSNYYADLGARFLVRAGPAFFYGQAGLGGYHTSATVTDAALGGHTSNNDNRLSEHGAAGAGFQAGTIDVLAEFKYVEANGHFSGATSNLDMGGVTISIGVGVHF